MSDNSWVEQALGEMERMTPKTGYNVVGVDRFEPAGEALYLIAHFDTPKAAETCRAEHEARTGNRAHVYPAASTDVEAPNAASRPSSGDRDLLLNPLSERFTEALAIACRLHRLQPRKKTQIPYVAHLLGVASIALEYGATEDETIAAVLHDAVEDQGGEPTAAMIREKFGAAVAEIVQGCTDATVIPKPPWRERKEQYIAHVREAPPSVRLVSASDKLHNARAILTDYRIHGEALWGRFNGGKEGTLWYYQALVEAFGSAGSSPLIDEFARTVAELRRLCHAAK